MISYKCVKCGEPLEAPDSLSGQPETCPKCGNVCVVPAIAVPMETPSPAGPKLAAPKSVPSGANQQPGSDLAVAEQVTVKYCPYCEEEIPITAKKCKHCGEWVGSSPPPSPATGAPPPSPQGEDTRVCEWCKKQIPKEAVLCPFCKKYRRDFHNSTNFAGIWLAVAFGCAVTIGFTCVREWPTQNEGSVTDMIITQTNTTNCPWHKMVQEETGKPKDIEVGRIRLPNLVMPRYRMEFSLSKFIESGSGLLVMAASTGFIVSLIMLSLVSFEQRKMLVGGKRLHVGRKR